MHPHAPVPSAQGLRQADDRLLIRALEAREEAGHARAADLRPRPRLVQILLGARPHTRTLRAAARSRAERIHAAQVYALLDILAKHRGSISIKELSDMTHFRTDDIVKTLQAFNLIRYFGGQHSIFISPKTLETCAIC